ncbi:MAG: hypothetical protein ABW318_20805 [Vicinamibacterales bacterium]
MNRTLNLSLKNHLHMPKPVDFDVAAAHKHFSTQCFNRAWDLIEKSNRTPEDDRLMVALNQASIFHWLQRDDCNSQRLSVGYWQASRIQALLGNAAEALRQANVCLTYSEELKPFYLGYAHEALARAHGLAGNSQAAARHLKSSLELANRVGDKGERELLLADLRLLQGAS